MDDSVTSYSDAAGEKCPCCVCGGCCVGGGTVTVECSVTSVYGSRRFSGTFTIDEDGLKAGCESMDSSIADAQYDNVGYWITRSRNADRKCTWSIRAGCELGNGASDWSWGSEDTNITDECSPAGSYTSSGTLWVPGDDLGYTEVGSFTATITIT